ncbi:hypothetical protein [Lactiplantibacillus daowaiensis]|uniref:Surface layer protein A domain-containing protein n=1 Tax=Lactiplantibacillus daowaiensis TaxID=2559918 RepID=A0ABW1S2E8_9LACO|nr:hypothetical protein [Lactiplantibacillus daowaiensis]
MQKSVMGAALVLLGGLGLTGLTAQATTKTTSTTYLPETTKYVRLKKNMYVGIYQKSGTKYKKLLKHKGALLQIAGFGGSYQNGHQIVTAAFTSGAVHYNRIKKLKFDSMNKNKISDIPLTTANFKAVKLAVPTRALLFQAGTGFKTTKNDDFTNPAAFYLTLDNYLQYYDTKAMTKYGYGSGAEETMDGARFIWKPTASVKVSKVTYKGKTTIIDYPKAIKGLPNKKISTGHYRLTITHNPKKHHQSYTLAGYGFDSYWTTYKINQKSYFVGQAIETRDFLEDD